MSKPVRKHPAARVAAVAFVAWCVLVGAEALAAGAAAPSLPEAPGGKSLLTFINAGGVIGYVIIAFSFAGLALAIDGFLRLRNDRLMPEAMIEQSMALTQRGKFGELRTLCKTNDSLLARIVGSALDDGNWGVDAVREAMQQHGTREITRLHQRIGWIGLIGMIAPMLGLLGTVTGMINSFQVLGDAKGTARPDELAVGISEALVTTTMGLIVAVPMMFLFSFLRDRVTRVGQDAGGVCERIVRVMGVVIDQRNAEPKHHPQAGGV